MRILATLLALAALPAEALELAPQCKYVMETGKLESWNDRSIEGEPVYVERVGDGFTGWAVYHQTRDIMLLAVIQNCKSGRELAVVLPQSGNKAIVDRWVSMVRGTGGFTLEHVAQEMARMGGKPSFRNGLVHGRCACDEMANW